MPPKKSRVLTEHEMRLMDVLWRKKRASVADVVAGLPPPPLAYSTVLTTLRTLEEKGYVTHEEDGRAFLYRAVVGRADAAKSAVHQVLDRFFGNSPGALAVTLLHDARLSDEDIAQLEQLLSKQRGTGK
jgi:predicted transcriptional regulator